jgi:glucuronosyltransferase
MTPRENAIYWIEYVIRHHGAPHMQYMAVHQNFWQRTSLDVIGFLAVIMAIMLKVFKFVVKSVVRNLFKRKKADVGDKKRK